MTGKHPFYTQRVSSISTLEDIEIKPVSNYKDLKTFYKAPFTIYENDLCWVAPLWKEYKEFFHMKNPYWNHAEACLFLAYKQNEIIGRNAAFVDHLYCQTTKTQTGFFGFYEFWQEDK